MTFPLGRTKTQKLTKKTYAQVARPHESEVAVSASENQNLIPDMLAIKKVLVASTKNTEIITNMLQQT